MPHSLASMHWLVHTFSRRPGWELKNLESTQVLESVSGKSYSGVGLSFPMGKPNATSLLANEMDFQLETCCPVLLIYGLAPPQC